MDKPKTVYSTKYERYSLKALGRLAALDLRGNVFNSIKFRGVSSFTSTELQGVGANQAQSAPEKLGRVDIEIVGYRCARLAQVL